MQNTVERNVSKDLPCRSLSLGVRFVCLPDPSSRYLPPSLPPPLHVTLLSFPSRRTFMLCKCDSLGERDVRASHGREVERHRGRLAWKIKFMSDSLTYSEIFPRYVSFREILSRDGERERERERIFFYSISIKEHPF